MSCFFFKCTRSEFEEIDSDKVKTAVKSFVHSCAGYSVATYVLVNLTLSSLLSLVVKGLIAII